MRSTPTNSRYRGNHSLSWAVAIGGLIAAVVFVIFVLCGGATAHDAMPSAKMPNGWSFEPRCCGNGDCYPVQTDAIHETKNGYRIDATGEVIPYQSYKILPSPDGLPYRCSTAGKPEGITFCIYMPKGGV